MELHAAAVEVAGQHRGLAEAHLAQLRLLEVGVDIDRLDRHDGHQQRPGGDPLADLDGVLGDHAVDGRGDACAAEIQFGLFDFRARRHDFRVGVDARAIEQGLVHGAQT